MIVVSNVVQLARRISALSAIFLVFSLVSVQGQQFKGPGDAYRNSTLISDRLGLDLAGNGGNSSLNVLSILNLFGYNVNYTDSPKCTSLNSSLDQQNLTMDSEISSSNFRTFIIEEVDRYQCIANSIESISDNVNYSIEQAYGFGTLAIVLISVLPIILFFFIPSDKKWYYPYVMNTLMALAASTLVCDAVLHLIPEALGIEYPSAEHSLVYVSETLKKQIMVLVAVYGMYLFEMVMGIRERLKEDERQVAKLLRKLRVWNNLAGQAGQDSKRNSGTRSRASFDRCHSVHLPASNTHVNMWALSQIKTEESDYSDSDDSDIGVTISASPKDHQVHYKSQDSLHSITSSTKPVGFSMALDEIEEGEENELSIQAKDGSLTRQFYIETKKTLAPVSVPSVLPSSVSPCPPHSRFTVVEAKLPSTAPLPTPLPHLQRTDHHASNITLKSFQAVKPNLKKQVTSLSRKIFKGRVMPKKSFGWIILLTDITHNIMDGITIGAAFSKSPVNGLSTALAIIFHEIPHELGDFAALMHSGVSKRAAIAWNLAFSLLSFLGLYIGLSISTSDAARQWVFAFATGIYLNHSLGEFFPELHDIQDNFWTYFALQNFGILLGFVIMFILSIFHHALYYDL